MTTQRDAGLLRSLMEHPGWRLFADHVTAVRDGAHDAALSARQDDRGRADEALRFRVLDEVLAWPVEQVRRFYEEED